MTTIRVLDGLRAVSLLCVMAATLHIFMAVPYANHHYDDVEETGKSAQMRKQIEKYHADGFEESFRGRRMFVFSAGRFGLQLSLVLSGFLVTFQLSQVSEEIEKRPRSDWLRDGWFYFILRRLFRLLPALLVVAPIVAFGTQLGPPFQYGDPYLGLLRVLTFFSAKASFAEGVWLMPWTWTLSVQMTFYVFIYPVVMLSKHSRRPARLLSVLSVILAMCLAFKKVNAWAASQRLEAELGGITVLDPTADQRKLIEDAHFSVLGNMPTMLLGAMLAAWMSEDPGSALSPSGMIQATPIAIMFATLVTLLDRKSGVWYCTLLASERSESMVVGALLETGAAIVSCLLVRHMLAIFAREADLIRDERKFPAPDRILYQALSSDPLRYLARWSYPAFLIHPVVAYFIFDLDFMHIELHYTYTELAARYVLMCVITFPLAALVHQFLERPALQLRGSIFPRLPTKRGPPAGAAAASAAAAAATAAASTAATASSLDDEREHKATPTNRSSSSNGQSGEVKRRRKKEKN